MKKWQTTAVTKVKSSFGIVSARSGEQKFIKRMSNKLNN